MLLKKIYPMSFCVLIVISAFGQAEAATLSALSSFGGGDGWLAPGDVPKLGTGNLERGMAYNPVTGNLLYVSRDGGFHVGVLDGLSGSPVGNLDVTGYCRWHFRP